MSSILGSLLAESVAVPQGVSILDSSARVSSEAALSAVSQDGLSTSSLSQGGGSRVSGPDAASWFDGSVNIGVSSFRADPAPCGSPAGSAHCAAPAESAHRVSLAESVPRVSFADMSFLDDDEHAAVVSEKTLPSEGLCSVLCLLFQLCPSAASEALSPPQRLCDFEGF